MNSRTNLTDNLGGTTTNAGYRSFAEIGDNDNHLLIHVTSPNCNEQSILWRHYMHDLDDFFIRLYKYHQKSGFVCLVCSQLLELVQIVYSVFLPIFFLNYIDYDILFRNKQPPSDPSNPIAKVHIYDVVKSYNSVTIPPMQLFAIFLAIIFMIWKSVKTVHSIIVNLAIRQFYKDVLHINDCSLLTWQDVQSRIISSKQNFLAQDSHLTELDIHNRILRHSNYMIALINRGILPIYYKMPFIGETTFFTQSFLYNCQLLFFRGPFKCIFEKNWLINEDVKNSSYRQMVAKKLDRNIVILAMINLLLSPVLFIWQILYFFYSNTALVKRDPVVLGLRNWSLYSRWFCRHFNELDHQLNDRLNHAYKPAKNYMDAFTSPIMEIFARHFRFVCGSTFAVLLLLTVYDEDVIQVVHLLTVMTVLWLIWSSANGFIPPDIPARFSKVEFYEQILQQIHYVPHNYPPFTPQARTAMANLFQYKTVKLLEDLLSTLATPYIMIRHLRSRSLEIVDFFRSYTIEVPTTGDVCVFSMMNIKENGNPQWQPLLTSLQKSTDDLLDTGNDDDDIVSKDIIAPHKSRTKYRGNIPASSSYSTSLSHNGQSVSHRTARIANRVRGSSSYQEDISGSDLNDVQQFEREDLYNHAMPLTTEHGKLELSLINFKYQNPSWNPSHDTQREFINQVTSQAIEQAASRQASHLSNDFQGTLNLQNDNGLNSGLGSVFQRPRSPQRLRDIDSSTAVSLSTLFLHEHARIPMYTDFPSTTSSTQNQRLELTRINRSSEQDPLL